MAIGARDVHGMYHACFIQENTIDKSDVYEQVQELFPQLLNRDENLTTVIETLRKSFACDGPKDHPTLEQFKNCSKLIKASSSFWILFSKAMKFEVPAVRDICVKKIKTIQDEFQKLVTADGRTLKECLKDPEFFNKKQFSYFKEVEGCNHNFHFSETAQNECTVPSNFYSEKDLAQARPDVANGMRELREQFTHRAKQGELLQDQLIIDTRVSSTQLFRLVPYNPAHTKASYPYTTTLCALVYDEVKNNRICTLEEAKNFAWDLLKIHPLFESIYTHFHGDVQQTILDECLASITQFNDAFTSFQKWTAAKAANQSS